MIRKLLSRSITMKKRDGAEAWKVYIRKRRHCGRRQWRKGEYLFFVYSLSLSSGSTILLSKLAEVEFRTEWPIFIKAQTF
ncbi:hypothetical protein ACET3Z_015794 [Daucus carota]